MSVRKHFAQINLASGQRRAAKVLKTCMRENICNIVLALLIW